MLAKITLIFSTTFIIAYLTDSCKHFNARSLRLVFTTPVFSLESYMEDYSALARAAPAASMAAEVAAALVLADTAAELAAVALRAAGMAVESA